MNVASKVLTKRTASTCNLVRGLNLPVPGLPEQTITRGSKILSVALNGADYVGLKPRMLIEQGEHVTIGQPLFVDKRDETLKYTSPAAGTISMINRGARRTLQSVVIEMDESQPDSDDYRGLAGSNLASLSADDLLSALYKSGLWTAFRTRPYSKVPLSGSRPTAIFVTAIDTQPLAGDPNVIVNEYADAFECGLSVVGRLTDGAVHLCTAPGWTGSLPDNVQHTEFAGPHPAGLAGTHIHFLEPVSASKTVWYIGYQDVIAIGKLFGEGVLWTERVVALGGSGFNKPRLVTTCLGSSIDELTGGELEPDSNVRLISGSVLNGRAATGADAFLGRYHQQVTALKENSRRRLFGWLVPDGYSFSRFFRGKSFTTAQHGRPTAIMPIDAFDKVMPLRILPVPLLKALLIKNTDQAQLLGCLELDPEDLALCTFLCPGKIDYGAVLQANLDQIEREG